MVEPRPLWGNLLISGAEVLAALLQEIGNKWFDLARLQSCGQVEGGRATVETP